MACSLDPAHLARVDHAAHARLEHAAGARVDHHDARRADVAAVAPARALDLAVGAGRRSRVSALGEVDAGLVDGQLVDLVLLELVAGERLPQCW